MESITVNGTTFYLTDSGTPGANRYAWVNDFNGLLFVNGARSFQSAGDARNAAAKAA